MMHEHGDGPLLVAATAMTLDLRLKACVRRVACRIFQASAALASANESLHASNSGGMSLSVRVHTA